MSDSLFGDLANVRLSGDRDAYSHVWADLVGRALSPNDCRGHLVVSDVGLQSPLPTLYAHRARIGGSRAAAEAVQQKPATSANRHWLSTGLTKSRNHHVAVETLEEVDPVDVIDTAMLYFCDTEKFDSSPVSSVCGPSSFESRLHFIVPSGPVSSPFPTLQEDFMILQDATEVRDIFVVRDQRRIDCAVLKLLRNSLVRSRRYALSDVLDWRCIAMLSKCGR
ncbi:hypothetical protein MRX96_017010 [Rhipicephalus microplus]